MISHKLFKELKEAGFPLIEKSNETPKEREYVQSLSGNDRLEIYYFPTLSELIEACGNNFMMLVQRNAGQCWGAVSIDHKDERGPTPEEAVARLWLALNKK